MKKSSSRLLVVMVLFFISCKEVTPPKYGAIGAEGWVNYKMKYEIVEADSCEYIMFNFGTAAWGGHRERCKYCQARIVMEPTKGH